MSAAWQGFQRVAHIRLAFLVFEDVPQILLLLLYVAVIDGPTGLSCQQCALQGEDNICVFGSAFPRDTLIISLVGILASFISFTVQVTYSYFARRV